MKRFPTPGLDVGAYEKEVKISVFQYSAFGKAPLHDFSVLNVLSGEFIFPGSDNEMPTYNHGQ
jgi:hypothetical protein